MVGLMGVRPMGFTFPPYYRWKYQLERRIVAGMQRRWEMEDAPAVGETTRITRSTLCSTS